MDIADQLRVLEDAQGDPAKLVLAAVDLAFPAASSAERNAIKQTLEAAAIPHWCNEAILAELLDLPPADSAVRFALLRRLRDVERFEARGTSAVNIHESARLALRKRMAHDEPERFGALSARAAEYFAADRTPTGQIERIYHRLCAEPDAGAAECEALVEEWDQSAYPEDRDALALALYELESSGLVDGRARLEVLLCYGTNQYEHREIPHVVECAREALGLAKETGHATGEARANDLFGQALRIQGHLSEALTAYQATLSIFQDIATRYPADAVLQRQLAVTHLRLGDVYDAQTELGRALEAFRESSRISQTLSDHEPSNPRRQREAATTYIRVGDILQQQNQLDEARKMYSAGLRIFQRLVEAEPENEDWQRDLAVTYWRAATLYAADHLNEEARQALNESLRIHKHLLSQNANHARRQGDLAIGYSQIGFFEKEQGQDAIAQTAFSESYRILRQLVTRDPSNTEWRSQLAGACFGLSQLLLRQKELAEAQEKQEESLQLLRDLSVQNPANLQLQSAVAVGLVNVGVMNALRDLKTDAVSRLEEASRIYASLVNTAPDNADWAVQHKRTDQALAVLRASLDVSNPPADS
jgi:tetratricopeptide (TPR) repeat protein